MTQHDGPESPGKYPPPPSNVETRPPGAVWVPHPFRSWWSRLWRTLLLRPGVYSEIMHDRHAIWQAVATWLGVVVLPTLPGGSVGRAVVLALAFTVGLLFWSLFHFLGAVVFGGPGSRRYSKSIRIIGFSLVPLLLFEAIPRGTPFPLPNLIVIALVIWVIAIQVHGTREALDLSWPRAIPTVLVAGAVYFAGINFVVFTAGL